jgi:calcium-independent phospholipase A2
VKLLIVFDADLTMKNHNHQTALDIANSEGATKIAEDIRNKLDLQNGLDNDQPKNPEFVQWTPEDILMLSLDGGGIRGLVFVQVLIEMEKRRKKLYPKAQHTLLSKFNWVTGNSTGGIAALEFTAAQKGAVEGRRLYFHLKDKVLGHEPPIPNESVDAVFKNIYGAHKTMSQIKEPMVSVMTTLVNESPPVLHIMSNYGGARNFQDPPEKQLVWKAARATSSVPIFFHPQDEKYIDGGLIANNPTTDAIIDMYDYAKKEGKNLKLKLVLSLGCGFIKPECIEDIDFEPSSCGKIIDYIMDTLGKHQLGEYADEILLVLKNFKAFKQLMDVVSAQMTQPNGEVLKRAEFISKTVGAEYFRIDPPIPKIGSLSSDDKQLIDMLYQVVYYMLKKCRTVTDPVLAHIYGQ